VLAVLPPRSNGKPEAATAVNKLLMMGMSMPETCRAVFKRQAIKLRDWCIWLVDLFEYMLMHKLTNPKYDFYSDTKDFEHCTGIRNHVINYGKEMRRKRGKNFNTWVVMQFLL
jgi:hypothetical protein